jgi:hypothetical protein
MPRNLEILQLEEWEFSNGDFVQRSTDLELCQATMRSLLVVFSASMGVHIQRALLLTQQ